MSSKDRRQRDRNAYQQRYYESRKEKFHEARADWRRAGGAGV